MKNNLLLFFKILLISLFIISCTSQITSEDRLQDISKLRWYLWLDREAAWEDEKAYLPPVDISLLPVHKPTGGWEILNEDEGIQISLPATIEEHFWGFNGNEYGISGNYTGVSWFYTSFIIPESSRQKKISLCFESVNYIAEIFVNKKLIGYEGVSMSPFEVDITEQVNFGENNDIAIRITDPHGNLSSNYGFGGITGSVFLKVTDKTYLKDLFIKNTQNLNQIELEIIVQSDDLDSISGMLNYKILDAQKNVLLDMASTESFNGKRMILNKEAEIDTVKKWNLETPYLYEAKVFWIGTNGAKDSISDFFGFKWFDSKNIEGDRQLLLNNKRIVLRSAVTNEYWPENGVYPTEELAERQIRLAKQLGLNSLIIRREMSSPYLFDLADQKGVLLIEQPVVFDYVARDSLNNEKHRMRAKRRIEQNRNHPSFANINIQDSWLKESYNDKTNSITHLNKNSKLLYYDIKNSTRSPGRLELINFEILKKEQKGWDSYDYLNAYNEYFNFLNNKGFIEAFGSVDALTKSLGNVLYYDFGKTIENIRVHNISDGYAINGWDEFKLDGHSGIVDIYRNPKGNSEILSHYNQPLYIAIKESHKVLGVGDTTMLDFYMINENNLQGEFLLNVSFLYENEIVEKKSYSVNVTGGFDYSELLIGNVEFSTIQEGYTSIEASLVDGDQLMAQGKEKLFTVNYKTRISEPVAFLNADTALREILSTSGITDITGYDLLNGNFNENIVLVGDVSYIEEKSVYADDKSFVNWLMNGGKMVVLSNTDKWANYLMHMGMVDYRGSYASMENNHNGNYFVRAHSLFEGLPVNTAFNWVYQAISYESRKQYGIRLQNGECIVGFQPGNNKELFDAVSIIPVGRGKIILSTLDLKGAIMNNSDAAIVAKKMVQNFILQ